jgi:CobQ-like glutamine amidotransferase family enzyme
LFNFWDDQKDGYIRGKKLASDIIALGLARNTEFVYRLISIILRKPFQTVPQEKITLKDFQDLC